jgi:hypothetical protein
MAKQKRKNDEKFKRHSARRRVTLLSRPEKQKRTRSVRLTDSLKTVVEWRLPKQLEKERKQARGTLLFVGLWFFIVPMMAVSQINDRNDWALLGVQGETQFAPLVKTESHSCGRHGTCYSAIYEYQGAEREQSIGKANYKALLTQDTVEIIAAGSVSRIAGTRPDFQWDGAWLGILGAAGVVPLVWASYTLAKIRRIDRSRR